MRNSAALRWAKRRFGKGMTLLDESLSRSDEMRAAWNNTASFRRMLKEEKRRNALCRRDRVWQINAKDDGIRFADMVGIPVPPSEAFPDVETLMVHVRASSSQLVVKPVNGDSAQGIHIVYGPDDIVDLGRRQQVNGLDGLAQRLAASKRQGWLVETFLPSTRDERCPAHDLKFHCFYGRVALVLEIRRHPKIRCCWWNAEGEKIGKVSPTEHIFDGEGFTDREKDWAIRLSREIPTPFMRIDILRSSKGSFFGEFTPLAGRFQIFSEPVRSDDGRDVSRGPGAARGRSVERKDIRSFPEGHDARRARGDCRIVIPAGGSSFPGTASGFTGEFRFNSQAAFPLEFKFS